jgi:hypothetical protein
MSRIEEICVAPEAVELVGHAALPLVASLDEPVEPRAVAQAASPHLEALCLRSDLPPGLERAALAALGAARAGATGRSAYATFLRAMHELLKVAGLPAPAELSP